MFADTMVLIYEKFTNTAAKGLSRACALYRKTPFPTDRFEGEQPPRRTFIC
jgi:hypothetical protein